MDDTKYSLWLVPSDENRTLLMETILHYSNALGTPIFKPHITLTSQLPGKVEELKEKTRKLAASIDVQRLTLGPPAHSNSYFQCVFLPVESNPLLLDAYLTAQSVFILKRQKEYNPHLSLIYGNLNKRDREKIVAELGDKLSDSIAFNAVCIYRASSDSNPNNWMEIGYYSLGQS